MNYFVYRSDQQVKQTHQNEMCSRSQRRPLKQSSSQRKSAASKACVFIPQIYTSELFAWLIVDSFSDLFWATNTIQLWPAVKNTMSLSCEVPYLLKSVVFFGVQSEIKHFNRALGISWEKKSHVYICILGLQICANQFYNLGLAVGTDWKTCLRPLFMKCAKI